MGKIKQFIIKNKIILAIIAVVTVIAIIATVGYFFIIKEKLIERKINNVDTINMLLALEESDEIKATQMVKSKIVKITNTINDVDAIQIGTGFFDKSGYVVTNSHIVDRQGIIKVTYNAKEYKAYIVSNDIISDVALLYVDGIETENIEALSFGSTLDLQEPATVICLGYALNLEGDATVTKGAFSGRRSAAGIEYLQSDAAVNPGMSGGPLINAKAELIGMNALASDNATINMSISSETLENIIAKLINNKEVNYITGERPENALSSALKETSYNISDLYGEKDIFDKDEENDKQEEEHKKEEEKNETSTNIQKPSTNIKEPTNSKEPVTNTNETTSKTEEPSQSAENVVPEQPKENNEKKEEEKIFTVENGTIKKYNVALGGTDVVIPSEYDGQKITKIGSGIFRRLGITSLSLPDTVTEIGMFSFADNLITSLNIPGTVKKIGVDAFSFNQISTLTLNEGISSIEASAFFGNKLTSIKIPNSISVIEESVFCQNELTSVTMGTEVKRIKYAAFADNNLTTITIPSSVMSISCGVFMRNDMTKIIIEGKSSLQDFTSYCNDEYGTFAENQTWGNNGISAIVWGNVKEDNQQDTINE